MWHPYGKIFSNSHCFGVRYHFHFQIKIITQKRKLWAFFSQLSMWSGTSDTSPVLVYTTAEHKALTFIQNHNAKHHTTTPTPIKQLGWRHIKRACLCLVLSLDIKWRPIHQFSSFTSLRTKSKHTLKDTQLLIDHKKSTHFNGRAH